MKKCLLSLLIAAACLSAALPEARAEMVYSNAGGGGGASRNPNHIDFVLQFNSQLDDSNGVNDGGGIWLGYRHSLNQFFSLGGKLGIHSYSIENGNAKDTVSSVPLLFTAQVERNFERVFNIFGQIGLGPCFNSIEGDVTDAFNLELGTSLALDIAFGGTFEMTPNVAIGIGFDWFISSAPVDSPSAAIDDSLNISHFGVGFIFVGSF